MSDASLPKDPVSLEDLQQAIAAIPAKPSIEWPWDEYIAASDAHQHARAEAWRTAFEWREDWRKRCQGIALQSIQWSTHCEEGDEGMCLIREKLQS